MTQWWNGALRKNK